jgi:hypothetical protein
LQAELRYLTSRKTLTKISKLIKKGHNSVNIVGRVFQHVNLMYIVISIVSFNCISQAIIEIFDFTKNFSQRRRRRGCRRRCRRRGDCNSSPYSSNSRAKNVSMFWCFWLFRKHCVMSNLHCRSYFSVKHEHVTLIITFIISEIISYIFLYVQYYPYFFSKNIEVYELESQNSFWLATLLVNCGSACSWWWLLFLVLFQTFTLHFSLLGVKTLGATLCIISGKMLHMQRTISLRKNQKSLVVFKFTAIKCKWFEVSKHKQLGLGWTHLSDFFQQIC